MAGECITGGQASVSKEQTAVSQSQRNQEPSKKKIIVVPYSLKSAQKAASCVASVESLAEGKLKVYDSLDVHGSHCDVRPYSGVGHGSEHRTNDL